jgi:serine/threonine protein kinase
VLRKNKECDLQWLQYFFEDVSPECKHLILLMLQEDPSKRPSAKQALIHPWFKQDEEIIAQLLQANKHHHQARGDINISKILAEIPFIQRAHQQRVHTEESVVSFFQPSGCIISHFQSAIGAPSG